MTTLEKIRAEIEQLKTKPLPFDGYDECVKYALQIIDKYAEQETDIENIGEFCHTHGLVLVSKEMADKYAEQEPTVRHSCENCKILELLVDFEMETICEDDDKDLEYCENNCNFKAPTKECYLHWAEHKRKAVSE